MGFKTISLSDRTYRRLRAEKRPGESFTDVIERLLSMKQPPLAAFAGAWRPVSAREIKDIRTRVDQLRHRKPAR